MVGSITVRTQDSRNITVNEAEEIAAAIRGLNLDSEVRVEEHERKGRRGLTWFEVLYITVAGGAFKAGQIVAEEAIKKITEIVIDWARQRFKGRKSESNRSVYLEIHVPDDIENWIAKAIVIKNATDEPEDRTEQQQRMLKEFRERSGL